MTISALADVFGEKASCLISKVVSSALDKNFNFDIPNETVMAIAAISAAEMIFFILILGDCSCLFRLPGKIHVSSQMKLAPDT